ncbi:hypothetical protein F4819DRAFT_451786 [Hypoxylon fuscum]|nr:hypothetical protein F4819DRAFT_451786 [Hypoxylon fuscum]
MGNPTEAGGAPPQAYGRAGPPPYAATEDATGYAVPSYEAVPSGASTSTSGVAGVSNRFPQSLNAYFPKIKLSKNFHLGEHADNKLFAVTMHTGMTSNPMLELHSGPSHSDPVIATADNESKWGSSKKSVLQVTPAGSSSGSRQTIRMNQQSNWTNVQYPFSVEVGLGKDVRQEDFEWRRTGGGELRELDKWVGHGWKLVQLGSSATGQGGERAVRSPGATSDGLEVVAVFSQSSSISISISKVFKFRFLESGATGVLGDAFAQAAVVGALKIWYVEFTSN